MMPTNQCILCKLLVLTSCFYSNLSLADSDKSNNKNNPETIEVTAQKHPQAYHKVPISLNTISEQTIKQQNLKDTTELSAQAANFKISQNIGEGTPPAVNIRGVGSIDYNSSTTSPVGIYLDHIAAGSANSQVISLFDIESIEILRGPQATLFGRNTNAGAVLLRSHRPEPQFSGTLSAGIAQRAHQKFEGAVNLPFDNHLHSRFAFSHQDYNYSTNNLHPTSPTAGMKQNNWRFSLLGQWQNVEVFSKIHGGKWDGITLPMGNLGLVKSFDPQTAQPASFCSLTELGSSDCTDNFGFSDGSDQFHDVAVDNHNTPHNTDTWGIDNHIKYTINDQIHLESITSFNQLERLHAYKCDASTAQLCHGALGVETEVITQELRLHADLANWYIIGGLYYLDESITQDNQADLFRDYRQTSLYNFAIRYFYDNQIDISAYAAFAHGEYQLNDQSSITTGLRYSYETTDYRAVGAVNVAQQQNDQTGLNIPMWDVTGEVSDGNWSGKLAFNHIFSPTFSGFTSYSRGFKSGGYNGALIFSLAEAENNVYGPETLDAYEIGGRLKFDDDNARLNFALFYYDYKDQQVFMNQQALDPNSPPIQLLDNVGKSVIYGAETDIVWQLTTALNFQFGIGYLPEANLTSFVDAAGNEIKDNRLPFTSKWNVNGLFEYRFDLAQSEIILQVNFDHQSKFYFDQNQSPYTKQEAHTIYNARAIWQQSDWSLSLWGKNITNEHYSHLRFSFKDLFGMVQDYTGAAKQYGIDVSYQF